jgi:hypothetical protein
MAVAAYAHNQSCPLARVTNSCERLYVRRFVLGWKQRGAKRAGRLEFEWNRGQLDGTFEGGALLQVGSAPFQGLRSAKAVH